MQKEAEIQDVEMAVKAVIGWGKLNELAGRDWLMDTSETRENKNDYNKDVKVYYKLLRCIAEF